MSQKAAFVVLGSNITVMSFSNFVPQFFLFMLLRVAILMCCLAALQKFNFAPFFRSIFVYPEYFAIV